MQNKTIQIKITGANSIVIFGLILKQISKTINAINVYKKLIAAVTTLDIGKIILGCFTLDNNILLSIKEVIAEFVAPENKCQII